MYRRAAALAALCVLLILVISGVPGVIPERILSLYRQSDKLFHLSRATPVTDSTALAGFEQIIVELDKTGEFAGKDTLLFQSWLKKGILLDSKYDYTGARDAYRRALGYRCPGDSLLFLTYVNTGASYYNLNHFDSASYFLLRAESMPGNFKGKDDQARLYNTLGVLYFDNGNYQQAKNYFSHALGLIEEKKPLDTASAVSLQINIATSHYHLHQYEEALAIYKRLLQSYHLFAYQIYINIGNAYTGLGNYREALGYFRKVDGGKIPTVLNEIGKSYRELGHPDSSALFLDKLQAMARNTGGLNKMDLGINHLYKAELYGDKQDYTSALAHLQQSIIIFSRNFTDTNIYKNPSNFTGTYAYYHLFDALLKKAEVFRILYQAMPGAVRGVSTDRMAWLKASYDAYRAALSLLRYIEKSYDTDDAKLFLKKRSGQAYEEALSNCLELSRTDRNGVYMNEAFLIAEKSKASIITANLEENTFAHAPGIDSVLLRDVRNIKYNIARLNVKSEETTDKKELEGIDKEKAGYEIRLSQLQNKLEQNGAYYRMKYQDKAPGIQELQAQLGDKQALVSFYAAGDVLHVFVLTRTVFTYLPIDSPALLQKETASWLEALQTTDNGRKFKGGNTGRRLYQKLIKPLQESIGSKDEWIIIPDGFLYFLPFESLPADEGGEKTVLETTTVSYRFSSRWLTAPAGQASGGTDILSFAPFASGGQGSTFPPLAASKAEIAGLQGAQYMDGAATKARFLGSINKYPIIHLATHAISSPSNAAASFIAFYPVKHQPGEDNLYLEELYGQDMNATKLVIISACETGQGQLVAKEGVISLSRAFAYAGCASTIHSLWKADDKATSFILQQFYVHLREGISKAKALREAKLDYLKGDALNKSPAYWAHLVLMGDTGAVYPKKFNLLWLLLLIPVGLGGMVVWRRKRGKEKVDVSQGTM